MFTPCRLMLIGLSIGLLTANFAAADAWLTVNPAGTVIFEDATPPDFLNVATTNQRLDGLQVAVDLRGLALGWRETEVGEFATIALPDEGVAGQIGAPGIPVIRRLLVAGDGATVSVSAQAGEAHVVGSDMLGSQLRLLPVQPPIEKIPGARENAEFIYDEFAYAQDVDYAAQRATVTELGIVRGLRLFLLEIWPVSYNPVAEQVTFWTDIVVDVQIVGGDLATGMSPFPGLRNVVLNPGLISTSSSRGTGNYLIIVCQSLESDIAGFATVKTGQGFSVSTHTVADGTANSTIKSYITGLWGGPDAPDYIMLVGDTNLIPHWVGSGEGTPDTDLQYACMDGASDWYPDIAIGRFPARTAAQLQAMVNKTVYYENGPLADPDYLKRAVFMAGDDNYSITEGTHEYCITTWLEPNGYQCDRLYEVTYGATTQDISDSFNDGRFFGIYSGHGGSTSWADGPAFSQTNVNALTNGDMYPFVCSFACVTGDYANYDECFMETWIRAANKGAVTAWGSSVNSYWDEDDILQRRLFDTIFDNDDAVLTEAGPVYNEAKMRLLAHYGATSTVRRYFEMYNLMGDPALPLPSSCSDAGTIELDSAKYGCEDTALIRVSDCGLNEDNNTIETVTVTIESDSEPGGESVLLTETSSGSAVFENIIDLSETNAVGVLLIAEGDTVTATYIDADDGLGGTNVEVTDTAIVDCTPPLISNVQATDVEARSATITFNTDEPARGIVYYGLSCGALTETAYGSSYSTTPSINLTGLDDNQTYFYTVEAEDEAGNTSSDDNGGACYTFATPEIPDYFTELFDGSDNDLDNLSLIFTPNGSNDFYAGCAEVITALPTDPIGGTPLTLSDDSYATVDLVGATVSIYGQSYSTIYPGSNGYITFVHGDSTYTETDLENHFSGIPRVSALFDDLNPSSGGTVSYKQLADRMAVTWENVPEISTSNSNTFQIELFFDGMITINYLTIDASDGLAGLSEGTGLDPDFAETDLSEMGSCGPKPPTASNQDVEIPSNQAVMITLQANDDGLPDPPGAITYIITSLPQHGDLTDVGASYVMTGGDLPYTLVGAAMSWNMIQTSTTPVQIHSSSRPTTAMCPPMAATPTPRPSPSLLVWPDLSTASRSTRIRAGPVKVTGPSARLPAAEASMAIPTPVLATPVVMFTATTSRVTILLECRRRI